jgi:hypothetical protein
MSTPTMNTDAPVPARTAATGARFDSRPISQGAETCKVEEQRS